MADRTCARRQPDPGVVVYSAAMSATARLSLPRALAIASISVLFNVTAVAAQDELDVLVPNADYDFNIVDRPSTPWVEGDSTLPPFPTGRLEELPLFQTAARALLIDPPSVQVGKDGVVRLTYVLQYAAGGRNVYNEGFQCLEELYRTYGFASAEDRFTVPKRSVWQPVPEREFRRFVYDFVCTDTGDPRPVKDILWDMSNRIPDFSD